MFKNSFSFVLVLLNCIYINAQKLIVVDAKTKLPLPFSNYYLFLNNSIVNGGYCFDNGEFNFPESILYDKIKVTNIGYENLEISKNNIINDTLLLTPTLYPLEEVVIKANKKEEHVDLGYSKSKRKTWLSAIKGMKICTFIANPFHETRLIHSFLFKIRNNNDTKLGFKLHLLEKDTLTNVPGKELLKQDIIVILEGKSNKDIEHKVLLYDIDFPSKGAFVGIEWFGVLNESNNYFKSIDTQNGFIELNDVSKEFDTFQQDVFSFFPWRNMEKFKNKSKDFTNFKNCPTASFGIKIYKN